MSIHCYIPKFSESIQYSIVFDDFCEVFNGIRGTPRIPGYSKKFHGYSMVFKRVFEKYSGLTRGNYPLVFHFFHRYSAKYLKVFQSIFQKVLSIPKYPKVKVFKKVFEHFHHFENIETIHEYLSQNTNTLPIFE